MADKELKIKLSFDSSEANKNIKDSTEKVEELGDETKELGKKSQDTESSVNSSFSGIKDGISTAMKASAAAIAACAAAIAGLSTSSIKEYANYEQLVGGVDTLFKDSSATVQKYAENAYKTAGLSANQYMETVTGFSASLLQSLDGDTKAAADKADMAIRDMSDNANKMGSDMEAIQNAYQGFAKQNYTMLDNLKLGYGGTAEEMQRLLDDAEKISGFKYDISSYSDIVDAIHVVQTELGITGTTQKEAESTITGSLNALKAAWSNFSTELAKENGDVEGSIEQLKDSLYIFIDNIVPRVQAVLDNLPEVTPCVSKMISDAINLILNSIPKIIDAVFKILDSIIKELPAIAQKIAKALPTMAKQLVDGAMKLIAVILQNLDTIIIPIIESIPDILVAVSDAIVDNVDIVIEGIVKLIIAITEKLPELIIKLIESIGKIILNLVGGIVKGILSVVNSMITKMGDSIDKALGRDVTGAWAVKYKEIQDDIDLITGSTETGSEAFDTYSEKAKTAAEEAAEAWAAIRGEIEDNTATTEAYWTALTEITDENGRIKEGYEDLAKTLVNDLNPAIENKLSIQDGEIIGYQELESEIDTYIQKLEAQALMEAGYDGYVEGLKLRESALSDVKIAQVDYAEATTNLQDAESKLAEEQAKLAEMDVGDAGYNKQAFAVAEAQTKVDEYNAEVERTKTILDELLGKYESLASSVETYNEGARNLTAGDYSAAISNFTQAGEELGIACAEGIETGIGNGTDSAVTQAETTGDEVGEAIDMSSKGSYIGGNLVAGIKQGINSNKAGLIQTASQLANDITKTLTVTWNIQSPSKVMKRIGGYLMEGLDIGINNESVDVLNSVKKQADSITSAFSDGIGNITTNFDYASFNNGSTSSFSKAPSRIDVGGMMPEEDSVTPLVINIDGRKMGEVMVKNINEIARLRGATPLCVY